MFPSDKPYPLVSPRMAPRHGRCLRIGDFTLPKPYRRKRFVEDGTGMSGLRKLGLAMSGLAIAGLIAALVTLARENLDSPPMPVVAAPVPPAAAAPAAQAAPAPTVRAALPPDVQEPAKRMVAAPHPIGIVPALAPAPTPAIEAPDPDVVLITAILTLTPPPEAEPE